MDEKKFNPAEHMMDLKGKQYLQVMWRLVWFREEHPDWQIRTEIVEHMYNDHAVIKAWILDPAKEIIYSEAHGSESKKEFGDYLEKAETKAVGRALAMLGYGTQFSPELDEEDRIVDSPVDRGGKKKQPQAPKQKPVLDESAAVPVPEMPDVELICEDCGYKIADYVTPDGKSGMKAATIAQRNYNTYGRKLCVNCAKKEKMKQANADK